jgi:hypothetical protein
MKLFNKGQLASEMGRDATFVSAMCRQGYLMQFGGKTTLRHALAWLAEHPEFRVHDAYSSMKKDRKPAKKKKAAPLLERLEKVTFGKDGLRELNEFMHPGEYGFHAVTDDIVDLVLEHEIERELHPYYENAIHAQRREFEKVSRGTWGIPSALVCFPCSLWAASFPLSWGEITGGQKPVIERESITAVTEIDQEWFDQGLKSSNPELSFHRLRIDWRKGSKAIQAELETWVKEMSSKRPARRGRTAAVQMQDKLNHLAAWRAHRAGLCWEEFYALSPRMRYTDSTSYRTAWKNAEAFLKERLKQARLAVKQSISRQ